MVGRGGSGHGKPTFRAVAHKASPAKPRRTALAPRSYGSGRPRASPHADESLRRPPGPSRGDPRAGRCGGALRTGSSPDRRQTDTHVRSHARQARPVLTTPGGSMSRRKLALAVLATVTVAATAGIAMAGKGNGNNKSFE